MRCRPASTSPWSQEATAAIDLDGSKKRKLTEMRQAGINLNATA